MEDVVTGRSLLHIGFWASWSTPAAGECGSSAEHPFRQIGKRVGGEGLAGKVPLVTSPDARVVVLDMVDSPARVVAHTEVASVATRGAESCRVAQVRPDCPAVITSIQHRM